ncbi:MAG TPA: DUF4126 family protein [Candidatus Elarobacter sp.]|nr:DUF4126 family protein [Candidatus Elarobacter sp.]
MPAHSDAFLYLAALCMGAAGGMRSMLAPATTALTLWRRPEIAPADAPGRWLAMPAVAVVMACLAVGELVADKLPAIPDRIAPGPLVARLVSGGVCGAAIAQVGHASAVRGALAGALGALLSAFGAFHARRALGRATGIRDPYIGALEDVIALAIAGGTLAALTGA